MHPEALLASALRAQKPSQERNAKIFWLAAKRTRELILKGQFDLAGLLVDEMRESGRSLSIGAKHFHLIGRRLLAAANDLEFQLRATRFRMADDLTRAPQ